MAKYPFVKPFESKRARAVAIPIHVYAYWYLFTNFSLDNPDLVPNFIGLILLSLVSGFIVNQWVKRRKRQRAEHAVWEEQQRQFSIARDREAGGLDAVNARLAALEAERDQFRQIAEEAIRTNQSGGLDRQSALDILGLNDDFTDADLKRQRIEMIKRSHPDQGGSHGLAKIVNEAFELLKK